MASTSRQRHFVRFRPIHGFIQECWRPDQKTLSQNCFRAWLVWNDANGYHIPVKWESGLMSLFFGVLTFIQAGVVDVRANGPASPTTFPLLYTPPVLTVNSMTNGQVKLTLTGEPGMTYIIETSPDLFNWVPMATNVVDLLTNKINLLISASGGFFRAWRNPVPIFGYALAAAYGNVNINGNGMASSSWNSHDPNESNNGLYNGFIGTNGNMACVSGLFNLGNHFFSEMFIWARPLLL